MPIEIKVIILATLVMGIFLYLDERKIKKERQRQERLNKIKWQKKISVKIRNVVMMIQRIGGIKKIGKYQSRKAYHKPRIKSEYYHWVILEYFCTTSCANSWLNDNLENIIERKHCPNKIVEKIIRQ